jgi:hypothetical protein
MNRTSSDEIRDGDTYNGYDYDVQVWVKDGVIVKCGHAKPARRQLLSRGCNACQYAGLPLAEIKMLLQLEKQ